MFALSSFSVLYTSGLVRCSCFVLQVLLPLSCTQIRCKAAGYLGTAPVLASTLPGKNRESFACVGSSFSSPNSCCSDLVNRFS